MDPEQQFMGSFELSAQAKERMRAWWKKWDDPKCPICQSQDWDLPNHVFCLKLSVDDLVIVTNSPVSPFFPVHCMTCGYAMFVNALASGVVVGREGKHG